MFQLFQGGFAAVAKKTAHTAFFKSLSLCWSLALSVVKVTDANQLREHKLHIGRFLLVQRGTDCLE